MVPEVTLKKESLIVPLVASKAFVTREIENKLIKLAYFLRNFQNFVINNYLIL
jgi:hypothetical protein